MEVSIDFQGCGHARNVRHSRPEVWARKKFNRNKLYREYWMHISLAGTIPVDVDIWKPINII
jgi:hypothetical protein